MARRIWLDVTGVRPGSDTAAYALSLYRALLSDGAQVFACRRCPGLVCLSESMFHQSLMVPSTELSVGDFVQPRLALPEGDRCAQDQIRPIAGDAYVMVTLAGDAGRFAQDGARLVMLASNLTVLARPEWREQIEIDLAAEWLERTSPQLSLAVVHSPEAAAVAQKAGIRGPQMLAAAADAANPWPGPAHPRPFIFASGEISEAGQTRQLLLVWRRLMETLPEGLLPDLVIAGPVGPQSQDVLTQLHNSRLLDGRARVILFPTPGQVAMFARDCVFAIAMAAPTGWGRGTLNAQVAGASCLSAYQTYGSVPFDPTNAASVAARVRAWLVDPPVKPPVMARHWDAVVRDLLQLLQALPA